jgi:hypothetical protein
LGVEVKPTLMILVFCCRLMVGVEDDDTIVLGVLVREDALCFSNG